jgi:inner membrane protein
LYWFGGHLPEKREVSTEGFQATWRVSSLGRALPSRWTSHSPEKGATPISAFNLNPYAGNDGPINSAFGVNLFVPIGPYKLTDRATKYAVLFIGLTFVAYFLFEVLLKLELHALQYLLVGFANALFYLLLLSLAEHIDFGWSYLVSAMGSAGLVAAYSSSILGSWRQTSLVVAMLAGLYGFLYLTLNAESYAMLAGSVGLWMILGLVMYLTRGIDWYQWGSPGESVGIQEELFAGKRT